MRALATALLALVLMALAPPGVASAPSPDPVTVTMSRSTVHDRVGARFAFTTSVHNTGDQPLGGLVAHLNVVSLDPSVYVDPEDWSSHRTQYLPTLPANGTIDLPWNVQAVNDGEFVLYVAVTSQHGSDRVVGSDPLRLTTTAQRSISSGGVLPVALGVPGVVALLMLLAARRRRLLRRPPLSGSPG